MTVMTPPRNPYSGMLASYLADGFFGREREVADLVQGVTARVPSSFVISGIRTIGKTTLLRYLRDPRGALTRYAAYMAPKYHGAGADTLARALRFVYVDFHSYRRDDKVLETLAAHLNEELDGMELPERAVAAKPTADATPDALVELLRGRLKALETANVRVIFLLDDFDNPVRYMEIADEIRLRTLRDLVAFVVATETPVRRLRPDITDESPWLGILSQKILGLLSDTAATALVKEPSRTGSPLPQLGRPAAPAEDQPTTTSGATSAHADVPASGAPASDAPPADATAADATAADVPFDETDARILERLAGRQPYLLTVACEALYDLYTGDSKLRAQVREHGNQAETEERIARQLLAIEAMSETLSRFWRRMDEAERQVAVGLAGGSQPDPRDDLPALARLVNKALVYQDVTAGGFPIEGAYHLFSTLFERVVRQASARQARPSAANPVLVRDFDMVEWSLGPKDRALFQVLRANPNRPLAFNYLIGQVWGSAKPNKRVLDAAIYRLRKALDGSGVSSWDYLRNVRGIGFEFVPDGATGERSGTRRAHAPRASSGPRASSAAASARPPRVNGD